MGIIIPFIVVGFVVFFILVLVAVMKIYDVSFSQAVKAICLFRCSSILCNKGVEEEEEGNYQEGEAVVKVGHDKK
jgi:hypothetical protein